MNSGNISSNELDEWEDVCRFHGDSRSMMILRLIGEVRRCWTEIDLREGVPAENGRAELKLVVNGNQNIAKDS